ncbi:MAG TPA: DM13 domain-containing protein, partial [Chloroflexota bacterium]|nr:DM13 domain-containing protein [Chloroflexota bacterium]
SGHPAPRDSRQLHEGGAFEIARLKGNVGDQNYELPADLDLSAVKSVVIYCRQFSVVFSTAELASNP